MVLPAILQQGDRAFGLEIRAEMEEGAGPKVPPGRLLHHSGPDGEEGVPGLGVGGTVRSASADSIPRIPGRRW